MWSKEDYTTDLETTAGRKCNKGFPQTSIGPLETEHTSPRLSTPLEVQCRFQSSYMIHAASFSFQVLQEQPMTSQTCYTKCYLLKRGTASLLHIHTMEPWSLEFHAFVSLPNQWMSHSDSRERHVHLRFWWPTRGKEKNAGLWGEVAHSKDGS